MKKNLEASYGIPSIEQRMEEKHMICENCKCKDECGWYASYKRIENEIYLGVGTDNTFGRALLAAMIDNQLEQCDYFE